MADESIEVPRTAVMRKPLTAVASSLTLSSIGFLTVMTAIALRTHGDLAILGGAYLAFFGALVAALFGVGARPKVFEQGTITAGANGVTLDGHLVADRRSIVRGLVVPESQGSALIRLERGAFRRNVTLQVPTVAEARRVLHAIGEDPTQTVTRFRLAAPSVRAFRVRGFLGMATGALLAALPLVIRGAGANLHVTLPVAFISLMTIMLLLVAWPSYITIGADGVLITTLGRGRYVPLREIERAELSDQAQFLNNYGATVDLQLKSGETVTVVARRYRARRSGFSDRDVAQVHASTIAERINEAVAAAASGDVAALNARVLARSSRPIAEWIKSLRNVLDASETFRAEAAPRPEQLFRVVEDATAEHSLRVAAALALSPHLDEAGKHRVRVAAQATAAPKLRIALEAAAGARDDSDLEEALTAIEEERKEQARS